MEYFELVGYRAVDMRTDRGENLKGNSCFFLNHAEQDGLVGVEASKIFVSSIKFPDFQPVLGQAYDLRFNQKGRLIAILDA